MTAALRKSLAAALTLGAAVFAWPVQALQCPRPQFWRLNLPANETFERMTAFAKEKVDAAQSIFRGHAVNIEFVGSDEEFPIFILTFKVTEWIKGDRKPYARIAYGGWCDGGCANIIEAGDRILSEHKDKIYISDRPSDAYTKESSVPGDIDGIFGLCRWLGRIVEPIDQAHVTSHPPHKWFLLDLAMRNAIEQLPSQDRSVR